MTTEQARVANGRSTGSGCGLKPQSLPRAKPITVNGMTIPRDAIARETQNHPAAKPVEAWLAAARALVVGELLRQEAARLAISPQPITDDDGRRETDDEARIRQLIEQEVRTPEPDESTCRRIYDTQSARFRSSDIYAVRHILFLARPGDQPARQAALTKAQEAIATLAAAPERFHDVALANSACPSREQGGALGQIVKGQTVPEFEAALATAPLGRIAPEPVETRYGFHVVLVDDRLEGKQLPFDVVRHKIENWLIDRARHIAIRQYITMLAGRAEIVGVDLLPNAPSVSR